MMVRYFVPARLSNSESAVAISKPGDRAPSRNYQVLVVDDDPDILQVVKGFLLRENITCRTVSNGRAAIKMVESGAPQLIILDIMMPGLSGYNVCRTLRETFPSSELPIIMLTGRRTVEDLLAAYQSGANDYITKPFLKDELIARVRCQLNLQRTYGILKNNLKLEKEVRLQKQKKEAARLMAEKEGMEKLRYQINPHFLFNALASIRGAVISDRNAAHKMVSHLAEFCRLSLSQGTRETHTIGREVSTIEHYLLMEKMRFGDYMNICIEIEPEIKKKTIPAFILQPLAENAIKFGTRTSPDFLEVKIVIKTYHMDDIFIQVSNSGSWVTPAAPRVSTGIGIKNIKKRLNKIYSGMERVERQITHGQVNIVLILPNIL